MRTNRRRAAERSAARQTMNRAQRQGRLTFGSDYEPDPATLPPGHATIRESKDRDAVYIVYKVLPGIPEPAFLFYAGTCSINRAKQLATNLPTRAIIREARDRAVIFDNNKPTEG